MNEQVRREYRRCPVLISFEFYRLSLTPSAKVAVASQPSDANPLPPASPGSELSAYGGTRQRTSAVTQCLTPIFCPAESPRPAVVYWTSGQAGVHVLPNLPRKFLAQRRHTLLQRFALRLDALVIDVFHHFLELCNLSREGFEPSPYQNQVEACGHEFRGLAVQAWNLANQPRP